MSFLDISILDTKKVIRTINDQYNVDYSDYSATSFKQSIDNVIKINNLDSVDNLIYKIQNESSFEEIFYRDISIPGTEMFRDPAAWRELAKILKEKTDCTNCRIWVPFCSTGEETYTLAIILKELGISDKIKVIVSNRSLLNIQKIKKGEFPIKQLETNNANYIRYKNNNSSNLDKYYSIEGSTGKINLDLFSNFEFADYAQYIDKGPTKISLILFRNKLIYYNLTLQEKMLETIFNSLSPTGLLFIGIKETIEFNVIKDRFVLVDKDEGIYRKKLNNN